MERREAIEKLREGIRSGSREKCRTIDDKYDRINAIRLLMVYLNEEVEDERNEVLNGLIEDARIKEIDDIAKMVIVEGTKFANESKDKEKLVRVVDFIKEGYQVRGRRHFEDFLIAVEWNYNWENKPYEIRKNVLREWVEWLEDLEYARLKVLSISAPPRTGKTFLGVRYFVWCMLRHPDRSCFFVSHTAAMASKVYSDVISTIEEPKNEITKIFPRGKIVQRNAEQNFIRLDNDSGNPYHTAYFRGIDGNMARSIGS